MEIYQLRSFIAVADEGNLTQAAKRLNTSQPSVSAHIKALEDEWGVTLFLRSKKGMTITDHGTILLQKAIQTVDSAEDLTNEAKQIKDKPVGNLKMGINLAPDLLRLNTLFQYVQSEYPQVRLTFIPVSSYKMKQHLLSKEVDCGFILGEHELQDIEAHFLGSVDYVLAGASPFKEKLEKASNKEILDLPWVVGTKGCSLNQIIARHFRTKLQELPIAVEAEDNTMLQMVISGAGIGLVEKNEANAAEKRGEVTLWRGREFSLNLYVAYLTAMKDEPKIRATLESLNRI